MAGGADVESGRDQDDHQLSKLDHAAKKLETRTNIVDWEEPEDPQNPHNWPTWKRMSQVVLASSFLLTA